MAVSPLKFLQSSHPAVRFFASVKLAIVLLALIALACVVGTLIPQADAVGGSPVDLYRFYVKRYGEGLHRLFNVLSFYRLFSSWWFAILLFGITASMVVCSLRRLRTRWRQIGFQLTHLSIVFLLAGVIVGLFSRAGGMQIYVGDESGVLVERPHEPVPGTFEQAQQLARRRPPAEDEAALPRVQLGFALHLDRFELKRETRPLDSILLETPAHGHIFSYNLLFQKRIPHAAGEPWDLDVLETSPVRRRLLLVTERPGAPLNPAVEIEFGSGDHHHTEWLFARGPQSRRALGEDTEIKYARCRTRAQLDRLLAEKTVATTATPDCLELARDDQPPTTFPLRLGLEQPVAGTSLAITALQFLPNWNMDPQTREVFSAGAERRNPAVLLRVRLGGAGEARWLFARRPALPGQRQFELTPLNFRFVESAGPRAHLLRAVAADESPERFLEHFVNGKRVETVPGDTSHPLALPNGLTVRTVRWLEHAVAESREEEDPGQFVARLRIRNRITGRTETILAQSGEIHERGNLRFVLERTYPVAQYISHVRVIDRGQTVRSKAIQMNDPLKYRGYTFYQSGYDDEAGEASRYTVLSVKKDPGVWFVYLGFGALTLGLVLVFYVNPLLKDER